MKTIRAGNKNGISYDLNKSWTVEGLFNQIDPKSYKLDIDKNSYGYLYKLDALYHILPNGKLIPFIAAGVGGITIVPKKGDNYTDYLVNYGAGFKYFLKDDIELRGDVRRIISLDDTHNDLSYSLGLSFLFGKTKETPNTDSDGDGVFDYLDKCPDTPKWIKVDINGCPPPDTDGDGVFDNSDNCPDTPKDTRVDKNGCPFDPDSDPQKGPLHTN